MSEKQEPMGTLSIIWYWICEAVKGFFLRLLYVVAALLFFFLVGVVFYIMFTTSCTDTVPMSCVWTDYKELVPMITQ